ncbi:MAG: molybdopterin-dependent oxidoreductase, partial [Acidobacteria bacterium]|nr:molybdopterin-dependent oxidoreductase [Acidobacteriota bacterium]
DAQPRVRARLQDAAATGALRFLVSAHAATEELFVLKQLVEGLEGVGLAAATVAWTRTDKPQPAGARFTVPPTDAPNVAGARDLGYAVGPGNAGLPDLGELRTAVESGAVKALYVIDPGPAGTLGDVAWIAVARRSGVLPALIVQGVLATELTDAADIVLPGSAYVEKDALYTNDQGRIQATSRAIAPPGEALEDWQILVAVGRSLGLALPYQTAGDVRAALAAAMPGTGYADADRLVFTRPVPARNWLQASNPSERWKWDFLFQDLPPVKGHSVQMDALPVPGAAIPLKQV